MEKSELALFREVPNIKDLASLLWCGVGKFPSTYIGLPQRAPFKSSAMWDVVKQVLKRLASWKRNYLFGVGILKQYFSQFAHLLHILSYHSKGSLYLIGKDST